MQRLRSSTANRPETIEYQQNLNKNVHILSLRSLRRPGGLVDGSFEHTRPILDSTSTGTPPWTHRTLPPPVSSILRTIASIGAGGEGGPGSQQMSEGAAATAKKSV